MQSELRKCSCGGAPLRRIRDAGPTNDYRKWVECPGCGRATSEHLTGNVDEHPADDEWNRMEEKPNAK